MALRSAILATAELRRSLASTRGTASLTRATRTDARQDSTGVTSPR
jgi:hypothetical protein